MSSLYLPTGPDAWGQQTAAGTLLAHRAGDGEVLVRLERLQKLLEEASQLRAFKPLDVPCDLFFPHGIRPLS